MLAALLLALLAQQAPDREAQPSAATPRETARRLLDSAVETAAGADPEVAACALLYVGESYESFDHGKAVRYLKQAFDASAAIPPGDDLRRNGLESRIVLAAASTDIPEAMAMLKRIQPAEAVPADPRLQALGAIVARLVSQRQFDGAIELIDTVGATGQYPFAAARQVFEKLPADDGRRLSIFGNAMSAYALRPGQGFSDFLARHWRELPKSMAESALGSVIENILKDDGSESHRSYTLGLTSDKGYVGFHNRQDAELFDLMQAVRAMDPKRADEILESRPELRAALRKFPEGTAGMGSAISRSGISGTGNDPVAERKMALDAISNGPVRQARAAMAAKDLSKAVAIARSIPAPEMRVEALASIAGAAAATDPATAKATISECIDAMGDVKDAGTRAAGWSDIAEAAHRAGEEKLAGEAIGHALDDTAEVYKRDTDAEDPNTALRDEWPSTNAYRHAIIAATKIMGASAESLLGQISDRDLALFGRVEMAQTLLGRPRTSWSTSINRNKK